MARKDQKAEVQHYVPKLLLRNHQTNPNGKIGSEQIWVFDKWNNCQFRTNIKNIASQSGYYDFSVGEKRHTFEHRLSKLENLAAAPLATIINERSLASITPQDRVILSAFVAVQFMRVETVRASYRQISDKIIEKVTAMGGDPNKVKGFKPLSENDIKVASVQGIVRAVKQVVPIVSKMTWCLMESKRSDPYFIGDTPVALHNEKTFGPYGNLGFAVPGIEIYFPISPELCLWITDPVNLAEIYKALRDFDQLRPAYENLDRIAKSGSNPQAAEQMALATKSYERLAEMRDRIDAGHPLAYNDQLVLRANSVQVNWANRFVMNSSSDFAVVKMMMANNPGVRNGATFKIE